MNLLSKNRDFKKPGIAGGLPITQDYLTSVHGIGTLPYLSNLKIKIYVYGSNWAKVICGKQVILPLHPWASKPIPIYKTTTQQPAHRALLSIAATQAKQ